MRIRSIYWNSAFEFPRRRWVKLEDLHLLIQLRLGLWDFAVHPSTSILPFVSIPTTSSSVKTTSTILLPLPPQTSSPPIPIPVTATASSSITSPIPWVSLASSFSRSPSGPYSPSLHFQLHIFHVIYFPICLLQSYLLGRDFL